MPTAIASLPQPGMAGALIRLFWQKTGGRLQFQRAAVMVASHDSVACSDTACLPTKAQGVEGKGPVGAGIRAPL